MRTIQEIFDRVINRGYYGLDGSPYMCQALHVAVSYGYISYEECYFAIEEIDRYLRVGPWEKYITLTEYMRTCHPKLYRHNKPIDGYRYWLGFYSDWEKRPSLDEEIEEVL